MQSITPTTLTISSDLYADESLRDYARRVHTPRRSLIRRLLKGRR